MKLRTISQLGCMESKQLREETDKLGNFKTQEDTLRLGGQDRHHAKGASENSDGHSARDRA